MRGSLMATVIVEPNHIHEFSDLASLEAWYRRNHDKAPELWLEIHKKGSGLRSVSIAEALDAALCWGWIDGIRKSLDDRSFLQRYSPRGKQSIWSQTNRANVERLIREGRMTQHGLRQVEAARADGRWDRAYASGREMKMPADLLAAIEAEPQARETFRTLNATNRYALAFRLHNLKTEAGRKKKIAAFVEMLKRGETIHQNGPARKPSG